MVELLENIEITKNVISEAHYMSKNFVLGEKKKNIFVNTVGAEAFLSYLKSKKINIENSFNLHSVSKFVEEFNVSDVQLANVYVECRVVFSEDILFIPKKNKEYGLLPDIYLFMVIDEKYENIRMLGYIEEQFVDYSQCNDEYYFVSKDKLKSCDDLISCINNYKKSSSVITEEEFLKARELFVRFSDHDVTEDEKKELISLLQKSVSLRESILEFDNFEVLSYSVAKCMTETDEPTPIVDETPVETNDFVNSNDIDELGEDMLNSVSPQEVVEEIPEIEEKEEEPIKDEVVEEIRQEEDNDIAKPLTGAAKIASDMVTSGAIASTALAAAMASGKELTAEELTSAITDEAIKLASVAGDTVAKGVENIVDNNKTTTENTIVDKNETVSKEEKLSDNEEDYVVNMTDMEEVNPSSGIENLEQVVDMSEIASQNDIDMEDDRMVDIESSIAGDKELIDMPKANALELDENIEQDMLVGNEELVNLDNIETNYISNDDEISLESDSDIENVSVGENESMSIGEDTLTNDLGLDSISEITTDDLEMNLEETPLEDITVSEDETQDIGEDTLTSDLGLDSISEVTTDDLEMNLEETPLEDVSISESETMNVGEDTLTSDLGLDSISEVTTDDLEMNLEETPLEDITVSEDETQDIGEDTLTSDLGLDSISEVTTDDLEMDLEETSQDDITITEDETQDIEEDTTTQELLDALEETPVEDIENGSDEISITEVESTDIVEENPEEVDNFDMNDLEEDLLSSTEEQNPETENNEGTFDFGDLTELDNDTTQDDMTDSSSDNWLQDLSEVSENAQNDSGADDLNDLLSDLDSIPSDDSKIVMASTGVVANSKTISNTNMQVGEIDIDINNAKLDNDITPNDSLEKIFNESPEDTMLQSAQTAGVTSRNTKTNNNSMGIILGALCAVVIIVALFFGGKALFGNKKADENVADNPPIEDNTPSSPAETENAEDVNQDNVISMDNNVAPAVNINKPETMKKSTPVQNVAPVSKLGATSFIEISKMTWQIPVYVQKNYAYRSYLQSISKSLKSQMNSDLLLANDAIHSNEMRVSMTFDKDGTFKVANVITSSNSAQIDKIVLQTVNETLKALKAPSSADQYATTTVILKINF